MRSVWFRLLRMLLHGKYCATVLRRSGRSLARVSDVALHLILLDSDEVQEIINSLKLK